MRTLAVAGKRNRGLGPLAIAGKRNRRLSPLAIVLLAAGTLPATGQIAVRNQGYIPFSDAPINYRSNDLHDPVARLEKRLEDGKALLAYEPDHGYLRSVLQLLDVPIDSQTLVFSKTSFQYPKISTAHPRALYFNDDVYVGWVQGGPIMEVASADPKLGGVFYTLEQKQTDHPVSAMKFFAGRRKV